jgi:hypothetical protein
VRSITGVSSEIVERLRRTPVADDLQMMVDVWIADDGLPSRIGFDVSAPDRASGSMRITADTLEDGVEVDAREPPADSVAEAGGG